MHSQTRRITIFGAIGAAAIAVALFAATNLQVPTTTPAGEQSQQGISSGFEGQAYLDLINQIKSRGISVQPAGKIQQNMFAANPQVLSVNNEDIWVFEYRSERDAKEELAQVAPDGTAVAGKQIHLVGSPHFFQNGTLVVFYEGSNQDILSLLESLLGPQIAGKS